MNIIPCEQRSYEWFMARCGRVTGSEVSKTLSFLKRGEKKGAETEERAEYKASILAEIMTGEPDMEGFVSSYMKNGTAKEPLAIAEYESKNDVLVAPVGFVVHPTIERAGASPDGLVGDAGIVEVKCCQTKNHLRYRFAGQLPLEYEPQVMFELACTEREWCDFISFDDRLPRRHQLFIKRVFRDDKRIAEIEAGVRQFLSEVDEMIDNLEKLNQELTQAQRVFGKDTSWIESEGITQDDIDWIKRQQGLTV